MNLNKNYKTLRFIFGDQLNIHHSWYQKVDKDVLYVVAELKQEVSYVKHHLQKLCAFFAAMENFANELENNGHHVLYLTLDDTHQFNGLDSLLPSLIKRFSVDAFEYQRPDEYRLLKQLDEMKLPNCATVSSVDTEHFLLPYRDIPNYVKPNQHNRMEMFYRKMRQRFNVLMNGSKPEGGQWNYDEHNRNKLKPADLPFIPQPLVFGNDVSPYLHRIKNHNVEHFGFCEDLLLWPISRTQSLQLLEHFCQNCLPLFGVFQDAMTGNHTHQWTLYHSRLSFALNCKMLHPQEVIDTAINTYKASCGEITLPQIEGFVRQILGWREYIRGIYWINMPSYRQLNTLNAERDLPEYFWDANTKMACMKHAIGQSLHYAYAHHIQRLMITGNFCLLTGIDPQQVDAWYLGIYIDAIEWVEMPNTRGMSQFADGGFVATKPYCAGGNYINKMSDYCKGCHYNIKEKISENACPFNSLYWHFMNEHRERFAKNPRIGMIYRNWDKQDDDVKQQILARAQWCLDNIHHL